MKAPEIFIPQAQRFKSSFGESPIVRASRIDSIVNQPREQGPDLTDNPQNWLVRTIDQLSNLPKKQAAALLTTAALLVPACADGTAETTTTPPVIDTTTSSSTTTPDTTLPEKDTTTTSETTTTTLPEDIGRPTGLVREDGKVLELGLFTYEPGPRLPNLVNINGRLISIYEEPYEDFQGQSANVYFMDMAVGENSDGSPRIIKVLLGRINDVISMDYIYSVNGGDSVDIKMRGSMSSGTQYYPIQSFLETATMNSLVENNSQIGIFLFTESQLPDTSPEAKQECIDIFQTHAPDIDAVAICEWNYEVDSYTLNNKVLVDALRNNTDIPNNTIIAAPGILFFFNPYQ